MGLSRPYRARAVASLTSANPAPRPRPELRVVESWGPFPIQPAIIRADIADAHKARVAAALLTMHERHGDALAQHGVSRFVAGDESAY